MPKTARLTESTEWIDLDFVERERTPREIIEKGIRTTSLDYHFRIQLFFLRNWVSNEVVLLFTIGYRKPLYSQLIVRARIALRSIRR